MPLELPRSIPDPLPLSHIIDLLPCLWSKLFVSLLGLKRHSTGFGVSGIQHRHDSAPSFPFISGYRCLPSQSGLLRDTQNVRQRRKRNPGGKFSFILISLVMSPAACRSPDASHPFKSVSLSSNRIANHHAWTHIVSKRPDIVAPRLDITLRNGNLLSPGLYFLAPFKGYVSTPMIFDNNGVREPL